MTSTIRDTADDTDASPPPHRRRWPVVVAIGVLVAGSAAGTAVVVPRLQSAATDEPVVAVPASATAPVEKRTVTAQTQVDGTLGYAGAVDLIGQKQGTVTALPGVGKVIEFGQVLYRVAGAPVIVLRGSTPVWRAFTADTEGVDVQQLNAALVALGYAEDLNLDPDEDTVTWRTRQAIKNLQKAFDLKETGELALGDVVFISAPVRVTEVPARLGTSTGPGQVVVKGTSTTPQVSAGIPVELAQRVKKGNTVTITLPDQSTAKGTVTSIGAVASKGSDGTTTVPIVVRLTDPKAAVRLDQAPVSIAITTATIKDVLVVPVTALLAQAGSGYAVEVADQTGTHLVPVKLGLFDSAGGVVQVTGTGLTAGQRVVVPSL